MRRPWLRDWSWGATRQLCKMAGPKNIEESAGTTVRIVRTVRRVHIPRGFRRSAPQILRADLEIAGILSVLVPQGTRTGANGRVLSPNAS